MEHFFDLSTRHTITSAGNHQYKTPILHPNRTMVEHDFIYMVSGTWKIGQQEEAYELTTGNVLILEAHRPHYGIAPCSAGTNTIFFHTAALETDRPLSTSLPLSSLIHAKSNPHVRHCFEKIVYAKLCGEDIMASDYFDVLLFELSSCIKRRSEVTIAEQIREHLAFVNGIPTNAEIASHLNISVKTAEQTFKSTFDKTIHQYLLEIKIEKAKQYLLNFPNMKLYEIADALGFYDEFHLSKQFKKLTGQSPLDYRRQEKSKLDPK